MSKRRRLNSELSWAKPSFLFKVKRNNIHLKFGEMGGIMVKIRY